jgi:hypothetical protein
MGTERRCTQRETPSQLSYVQLDQSGGGIVLNASENGLAFQVVAAVRSHGAVQVCISQNPSERIELRGEIAWLDIAKMRGGVQFKDASVDTRDRIRRWLAAECHSFDPQPAVAVPVGASDLENAVATEPRIENSALAKHLEAEDDSGADQVGAIASQGVLSDGPLPRGSLFNPIPKSADGVFVSAARFLLHITAGILLCALALTPILLSRNLRSRFADSLIRLGDRLKESEEVHVPSPQSIPVQSSAPNSANASAIPDADMEIPLDETQSQPTSSTPKITRQKTQKSTAVRLDDRSHSAKNLPDSHSTGRGLLVRRLWFAIESGNTSAEVALAQLYIAGNGVPKNCAQARVLLSAASKRGNQEAVQQLDKLNKSGCR